MVPTWIRGKRLARHYLWSRELSPCPEVLSSLCQVCICGWFIPWYASLAVLLSYLFPPQTLIDNPSPCWDPTCTVGISHFVVFSPGSVSQTLTCLGADHFTSLQSSFFFPKLRSQVSKILELIGFGDNHLSNGQLSQRKFLAVSAFPSSELRTQNTPQASSSSWALTSSVVYMCVTLLSAAGGIFQNALSAFFPFPQSQGWLQRDHTSVAALFLSGRLSVARTQGEQYQCADDVALQSPGGCGDNSELLLVRSKLTLSGCKAVEFRPYSCLFHLTASLGPQTLNTREAPKALRTQCPPSTDETTHAQRKEITNKGTQQN